MLSTSLEEFTAKWLAEQPVIQEMAARINVPVEDFAAAAVPRWEQPPVEVTRGED